MSQESNSPSNHSGQRRPMRGVRPMVDRGRELDKITEESTVQMSV